MSTDTFRGLAWAHGTLAVESLGGMLAPVTFVLPDGRQVNPLHVAPWADEPDAGTIEGSLRRLRGEWPCAPFGYTSPPDTFTPEWQRVIKPASPGEEPHGYCSNHHWTFDESPEGSLKLSLDCPESDPIRRVERTVTPDPAGAAVDITFTLEARRDCRLPIGLHPCMRLPFRPQAARIEPGKFNHGLTYPGDVAPGSEFFAKDRRFTDLAAVPAKSGGTVDASRVPLHASTEELLLLNGIDGMAAFANEADGYRVRITWQKEHFPSLLLWFSNRGRRMAPWNGRHLCLGMEPVCSPFGLGVATAAGDNPISRSGTPTAYSFRAGEPFVTRYRIAAEPL